MTQRTCEGYGLSVKGLEGVTFCRKAGARIVGKLVADLRTEVAQLRAQRDVAVGTLEVIADYKRSAISEARNIADAAILQLRENCTHCKGTGEEPERVILDVDGSVQRLPTDPTLLLRVKS